MKKIIISLTLITTLISCKKTWTCNCTVTSNVNVGGTNTSQTTNTTSSINDQKHSDANKICENLEKQQNNTNIYTVNGGMNQSATCTLEPN